MKRKVGPMGQVVIPKVIRDAIGLKPGDEVTFAIEGRSVRIWLAGNALSLKGASLGSDLVSMLETDRRGEHVEGRHRP